ncbi:MAG: ribosomal protein S18-alanine N-acetyltransferase [Alphaproteobacteria bacterium]|nr:ribosomal protein S18-alanine N-acetyltransferase [Alphaproteobacteria bacterium]
MLAALHGAGFEDGWSADSLAATIATPGSYGFIALDRGEPLGFVLMRVIADEAEVITVTVRPQARRQGVARALMDAALARAAELGATTAFLEVADDNAGAIRLYRMLGFTETGRRPGYYARKTGVRADALTMAMTLS